MNKVPLAKIARFINGRAFKPEEWHTEGLPIIRIQNLTETSEESNYYNGEYDERNLVKRGDILISWSASLGVYEWQGKDAILNQHIFKVLLNDSIDKRYFYHAATDLLLEMSSLVHGSTMQHITKDKFDALEILLPKPDEQKRIATILDKADRLRRQRRFAQTLSDSFLQSVFINMFGNGKMLPFVNANVANSINVNNWKWAKLTDVAKLKTGHTPSRNIPEYWGGDIPWITLTDIRQLDGTVAIKTSEYTNELGIKKSSAVLLPEKTVCLSRTASVGFVTVMGKEMATSQDFVNWICGKDLNPIYLMWALIFSRSHIKSLSSGTTHKTIYFPTVEEFRALLPPLPLQEKFAAIVQKFERVRRQQREATRQAEHLFQTLLHRAFRGEL